MVTFEEHIQAIKDLANFETYNITSWDCYSATIEYIVDGTLYSKRFIDTGSGWTEVTG